MKDIQCKKCSNKFSEKEIYTIQQFQYRKQPSYKWTKDFFNKQNIGEWDSFCEKCMMGFSKISADTWKNDVRDQILD